MPGATGELPRIEWVTGQQPLPLDLDATVPCSAVCCLDAVDVGRLVVTLRPLERYL